MTADSPQPPPAEELAPLVYDELRRLAAAYTRRERPGQTLQATALVHEAYLRLAGAGTPSHDKRHFVGIAARSMRQNLVERAGARCARQRSIALRPPVSRAGSRGTRPTSRSSATKCCRFSSIARAPARFSRSGSLSRRPIC